MFKVPGWSVPAESLKTQSETVPEPAASNDAGRTQERTGRRKRKRKPAQAPQVTSDNVADLFHEYFESGAKSATSPAATKSLKPSAGQDPVPGQQDPPATSEAHGDDATPRKRRKEKREKREKRLLPVTESAEPTPGPKNSTGAQLAVDHGANASNGPDLTNLTPLQSSMQQKLISSRFRHLNQTLYTTPSEASKVLFSENPAFFNEYHEGFRRQVGAWPQNPVEGFITWIKVRGAIKPAKPHQKHQKPTKHGEKSAPYVTEEERENAAAAAEMGPLPRDHVGGTCTIADLGCGDGRLATILLESPPKPSLAKKLRLNVRSFDLASNSPHVEVADISSLPLTAGSVDVAIFCLALMGTNWVDFIEEAYRILHWRGECWISEVSSRFSSRASDNLGAKAGRHGKTADGKKSRKSPKDALESEDFTRIDEDGLPQQASTDLTAFIEILGSRGFDVIGEPEMSNKMFVRMRFVKSRKPTRGKEAKKATDASSARTNEKRFLSAEPISAEAESRALKPCVYKQR